jgi:hypothetical protein
VSDMAFENRVENINIPKKNFEDYLEGVLVM